MTRTSIKIIVVPLSFNANGLVAMMETNAQ